MISALIDSGFVVDAQRALTFPSLPIKNFSKFHCESRQKVCTHLPDPTILTLMRVSPRMPGCWFFIHSQSGSTFEPLTSVLPSIGKVTVALSAAVLS